MALLQAVVIGLVALIITPGFLFYFDVTPKVALLFAGAAVVLLAHRPGPRSVPRWFSALVLLTIFSLGISTALSGNPGLSAFGTNWRRYGSVVQAAILLFAWLLAGNIAGRPDRVRTILRAIGIAGGLSALYGIAQYFGWDPLLPAAAYHIGEGIWTIVRPPGTFGYVSYFATWLLFVSFLSMSLAGMEAGSTWKRIAYAVAALSTVAMLLTGTRAALLGLLAGAAVWLYRIGFRLGRRVVATTAVALALGGAFYFSPLGWNLRSRARWFSEDRWGGARPALWRDSLRMAASRLPLGYGPEVFTATFPRFESTALAQAYPDFSHESPHNIFLDALISQGIPGLLLLAGLCGAGLMACWRSKSGPWLTAALAAGIVSQQFTVFTVPTALIFYATIALGVGLTSQTVEPKWDWRFTLAGVPVAVCMLYLAIRFTVSDRALALAQHDVAASNLNASVTHYNQYERWHLPGTAADLWYSRALVGLAQKAPNPAQRFQAVAQAGMAAVRATSTAEDPFNAWYNMAALYASQDDAARTEQSLRSAIAANPHWFKPHWTLARLLRLRGRLDEAEREAAEAHDLDAGKNSEVSQTLVEIHAQQAAGQRAFEHK